MTTGRPDEVTLRRHLGKQGPRSSTVLAQMLDAEGWTDHAANQIEGWWRRARIEKDFPEIDRLKVGISRIAEGLSEEDRKILGRFVGLHMRMGLDTGLRMGLAVRMVRDEPAAREGEA
jgi:hypothetical protein